MGTKSHVRSKILVQTDSNGTTALAALLRQQNSSFELRQDQHVQLTDEKRFACKDKNDVQSTFPLCVQVFICVRACG